jgi:hypothetical protein
MPLEIEKWKQSLPPWNNQNQRRFNKVERTRKRKKNKKKRKYIQFDTIGGQTKVQWGKRGGPVKITVLIPRKYLEKRLAKKPKSN